jgi:hypothetical protein
LVLPSLAFYSFTVDYFNGTGVLVSLNSAKVSLFSSIGFDFYSLVYFLTDSLIVEFSFFVLRDCDSVSGTVFAGLFVDLFSELTFF